jgi:diguanylate cyclase (GGDEF)-like protein
VDYSSVSEEKPRFVPLYGRSSRSRACSMEKPITETWVTPLRRPISTNTNACLVHIYPTGASMGKRYTVTDRPLLIGRGEDCDVRIHDHAVSRRHARVEPAKGGVTVTDLGSTNGTFVNDCMIEGTAPLRDGDCLRIGNCIYRFLAGGNIEAEYHEEIYRLTIIDALTQTHNHRAFLEFLDRELVRSNRHGRPLTLLMFDIDWFKNVNDEWGHLAGDFALRELSSCIRGIVRREDLFARYGGEEFAVVLVETDLEGAREVAERIRSTIEEHVFRFEGSEFRITISMGICSISGDESLATADMIRMADEKLFEAKNAGRNRVAC